MSHLNWSSTTVRNVPCNSSRRSSSFSLWAKWKSNRILSWWLFMDSICSWDSLYSPRRRRSNRLVNVTIFTRERMPFTQVKHANCNVYCERIFVHSAVIGLHQLLILIQSIFVISQMEITKCSPMLRFLFIFMNASRKLSVFWRKMEPKSLNFIHYNNFN